MPEPRVRPIRQVRTGGIRDATYDLLEGEGPGGADGSVHMVTG